MKYTIHKYVLTLLVLCYDVPSFWQTTNTDSREGLLHFCFVFLAFLGVIIWMRIQQGVVSLYATASYTMDLYICIGRSVKSAPSLSLTMLSGAEICVHQTIYICNHFGEIDLPKSSCSHQVKSSLVSNNSFFDQIIFQSASAVNVSMVAH